MDFIHPDLFQGEFFFRREITMIIKLKDGSVKEYSAPVTAAEITKDISMGLYRNACCVSINGKIADLRTVVESDCDFEVLTFDDEDGKKAFNHTASHVMAQAVKGFIQMQNLLSARLLKTVFIMILMLIHISHRMTLIK